MANSIKTDYMNTPNLGYSEYFIKNASDLSALSPKPGDRAIVADNGAIYLCIETGEWSKFGNSIPSGEVVIASDINEDSTNDDVAGAAAVYDYGQSLKTTIATTINSNSTNNDAAGASAVYNYVNTSMTTVQEVITLAGNNQYDILDLNSHKIYQIDSPARVKANTVANGTEYLLLSGGILLPKGTHGSYMNGYIFIGYYKNQNELVTGGHSGIIISGATLPVGEPPFYPIIQVIETIDNKITTIDSSSTDTQYPSAKAVYDFVTTAIASAMNVDENDVIPGGEG